MNGKEEFRVEQITEKEIQPHDDWRKKLDDFISSGKKWGEFHNNFSLKLPYGSLWYYYHSQRYEHRNTGIDPQKYKNHSENLKHCLLLKVLLMI